MLSFISAAPVLIFFISLAGAIITWLAADQFRDQLLADSHKLVREMALRYLQLDIGLFTLFAVGVVLSVGAMVNRTFQPDPIAPTEVPTVFPEETPEQTLEPLLPALSPTPAILPTATILSPESDPDLAGLELARTGGTSGVGVNLRDAPGLETAVLGIIPDGTIVTIIGETEFVDGLNWYPIIAPDGQEGWVTDLFLVFEDAAPQ